MSSLLYMIWFRSGVAQFSFDMCYCHQLGMISFIELETCCSICCWLCWLLFRVLVFLSLSWKIWWALLWFFLLSYFLVIRRCYFRCVVVVFVIFLGLSVIWAADITLINSGIWRGIFAALKVVSVGYLNFVCVSFLLSAGVSFQSGIL